MEPTGQPLPTSSVSQPAYLQTSSGKLFFEVPATWKIATIARFDEPSSLPDAATLVQQALQEPTGSPPLHNMLKSSDTVCILVEDLTRKSPKAIILRLVLRELAEIGINNDNITIVIALGTHRPLSQVELAGCFGEDIVAGYRFINHDSHGNDLKTIGRLSSGTPVKINRHAVEASFRLGIGSIFPHPLNGFGGGGKILFPGVADFDSIVEHHLRHSFRDQAFLGNMDGNSFYGEVSSLAEAGGLNFIVNSVLDHHDRLHRIVCGAPSAAHKVGTDICRAIISKHFAGQADVTIISAFPYSEGPQIMKPLAPASMTTRPRGWVILYADCSAPLSEEYYQACMQFREKHGSNLRRAVLDAFAASRRIMPGAPPELNMSMAQVMLGINDFNVILVSPDIENKKVAQLGFIPAVSIDEAIALCAEQVERPTVNIIPAGGVILPVLVGDNSKM